MVGRDGQLLRRALRHEARISRFDRLHTPRSSRESYGCILRFERGYEVAAEDTEAFQMMRPSQHQAISELCV